MPGGTRSGRRSTTNGCTTLRECVSCKSLKETQHASGPKYAGQNKDGVSESERKEKKSAIGMGCTLLCGRSDNL